MPNIEIVQRVCQLLDQMRPRADGKSYAEQITYVKDRPGHDRRYAIDARKLEKDLGWKPAETFDSGIQKTCSGTWTTKTGSRRCNRARTKTG